jgi:DNA polymerase V
MSRGGVRPGAGRPKGAGPWGETTRQMRVPLSLAKGVEKYLETRGYRLPLYASRVPAGFPAIASDDVEKMTDINAMLLSDPENCFLLRVSGDSMENAGIFDGDILIVNKKQEAANGKIVVAMIDNQVTVKRFKRDENGIFLVPENEKYKPIRIRDHEALDIAGVVTGSLRQY